MNAVVISLIALFSLNAGQTAKTSHENIDKEWKTFKIAYEKFYKDDIEETNRKNIFLENRLEIDKHNERYKNGEVTYSMKMNRFGDLALHEFREIMIGHKQSLLNRSTNTQYENVKPKYNNGINNGIKIPDSVDWVSKGYVTPVKDQGNCGAGWAFSATGSVEGQVFKKTGELIPLSEQNLLDCATDFNPAGCHGGGNVEQGLKYIVDNGGIQDESSYPYIAKTDICEYDAWFSVANISGFVAVSPGDESLADAVASQGPVSVSVNTVCANFRFYGDGVFSDANCSVVPDHGMLVVGYGVTDGGRRYWTIKNSWGRGWGRDGYMWMSRDTNNTCGVSENPVYPVV